MKCVSLVFALVVTASAGIAQTARGVITGTVRDPGGLVIGATVQARDQASGKMYSVITGRTGQFRLADLLPGSYEISVPQQGIRTQRYVKPDVSVEAGKVVPLDISLGLINLGVVGDDNAYVAIRNKYANVTGRAPRMPDRRPDFSGVWNANVDPNPEPPAMLPWAVALMNQRLANGFRDMPGSRCLPFDATPSIPFLYRIVQTGSMFVQLFETEPHYRQAFLDGRSHPADPDPTWMGHSIGKWEKDMLVIDTAGFNDKSWLLLGSDNLPHTDRLHMTERYRRPDLGHLTVDLTLEDPGTFMKPVERHMTWTLAPGEEILENICTENNKFQENAGVK
jgi:carboxypeptidase family protein